MAAGCCTSAVRRLRTWTATSGSSARSVKVPSRMVVPLTAAAAGLTLVVAAASAVIFWRRLFGSWLLAPALGYLLAVGLGGLVLARRRSPRVVLTLTVLLTVGYLGMSLATRATVGNAAPMKKVGKSSTAQQTAKVTDW